MSKRFFAVLVATCASAFGVVFASPAGAAGAVIVHPGESIQAAVDAAAPGTTIIVQRGTYAENVEITTDGIKLLGNGATLVPPANPAAELLLVGIGRSGGRRRLRVTATFEFSDHGPAGRDDPLTQRHGQRLHRSRLREHRRDLLRCREPGRHQRAGVGQRRVRHRPVRLVGRQDHLQRRRRTRKRPASTSATHRTPTC